MGTKETEYWDGVLANLNPDVISNNDEIDFDPSQVSFSGGESHNMIDEVLGSRFKTDAQFTSVRDLTAVKKRRLKLPLKAGTRVAFIHTLSSCLTYTNPPKVDAVGTVLTLRTANGPSTSQDGYVFVKWDDGEFRSILASHLRLTKPLKTVSKYRRVYSDLGDLSLSFITSSDSGDELVHKATKDLWAVKKDGSSYVIERLFDDNGSPLKV